MGQVVDIVISVLVVAAIAVTAILLWENITKKNRYREMLERQRPQIVELHNEFVRMLNFDSGYLMKKDWDALLLSASSILESIEGVPDKVIESSPVARQIAYVRECHNDPLLRETRNSQYKERELKLCDSLLSDIDGGKSLDPQQRDAIVTDEYSNLVIAGAGSGKTSVVVGKVKYLVERWGVDPADILVTSFTRASVDDLRSRIEANGVSGVSARTFHSLGLHELGNNYAVAPENALEKHVIAYLANDLASNPVQAMAFLEFFGLYSLNPGNGFSPQEVEMRMKVLKAQDMRTLKGLVAESGRQSDMETIRGERVKSVEELMIANFLFLNGVEYEYEKAYPCDIPDELLDKNRRAYKPDFYLVKYDIWLEHFGVDEHGRVPWMKTRTEEQSYLDGIEWKRMVHEACETKLIESYSWWNKDQDLLNKVEVLLRSCGVELVIDPQRNAEICGKLLGDKRFFNSMTQLISTFISLVKSNNTTMSEVDEKAREAYKDDGAAWHRYSLFVQFTEPIMRSYQKGLREGAKPYVDFDDMINLAADLVRKNGVSETYRYIIVDEYQDISLSRFGLLSAIRDATGAKLLCVGDDWQAIYRFAGSDVTLFTNFGKLVGYYEEMRIERTYRNSQELVDVASQFILKNPDQMRKSVVSMAPKSNRPPIAVASSQNQLEAFAVAISDLLSLPDSGGEIKVLGRNKHDLERIFPNLAPLGCFRFRNPNRNNPDEGKFDKVIVIDQGDAKPKEIGFMTVHKSKGLQADNVIVIGLVNQRCGFPNMISDDPILELLLADSDRYDYAEERRLFYVALTRTRSRVWLVTGGESGAPGASLFVRELLREAKSSLLFYNLEEDAAEIACPRCGGKLVKKVGPDGNEFIGCSNYPFCDKTYSDVRILEDKKKCPECGGWLIRRIRKSDGVEFFGCTNYPKYCYYAVSID